MTQCHDVIPFIDGELSESAADEFRAHLPSCTRCQREILLGNQLSGQLSTQSDRADLEWLLEYVSAQSVACSCHGELRTRLERCTSMLVRMTR